MAVKSYHPVILGIFIVSLRILLLGLKVHTNLLEAVLSSNNQAIEQMYEKIYTKITQEKNIKFKNIIFLGISFKKDTDDTRYSPILFIISKLIRSNLGLNIYLYDKNINPELLTGESKKFIFTHIESFNKLFYQDINKLIDSCSQEKMLLISQPWFHDEARKISKNFEYSQLLKL